MVKWWTRIFGRGERARPAAPVGTETVAVRREMVDGQGIVTVDLETVRPELRPALDEEIVRHSGFPPFEGRVEHGYALRVVATTEKCPRCGAPTRRCTANFIYLEEQITDMVTRDQIRAGSGCSFAPKNRAKEKRKRQLAAQSRRRNRR